MATRIRKEQIQGRQGGRLFLAAILCGPLAGISIMVVLGLIAALLSASDGRPVNLPIDALLSATVFGAIIGWPMMLVYGLPAHAFLYRRKSHRISSYILAGVFAGFLGSLVMLGFGLLAGFFGPDNVLAAIGGWIAIILLIAAVAASSLFWLIRRPDRDTPKPATLAATFE